MSNSTERLAMAAFLCVLLITTGLDIWQDSQAGDGITQIILDVIVVSAIAVLLVYIYLLEPLKARIENRRLARDVQDREAELDRASGILQIHLEGLGAHIKTQFDEWRLTKAEQEVALLLLKGFSMKEICDVRKVSERTIRQQATTIYAKADISGRAGLSAFFLEDLLLPI